ncbi:hypothetical protein F4825DRAFT_456429 [Nemania diffusa]|nr:hypothetical protein F4825DRAFT_456429 [Nemania diffusa]
MGARILLNLALAASSAIAAGFDSCQVNSSWLGCVSTRRDTATSVCNSIAMLPLSIAASSIVTCDCTGFEINYSCAKTYCSGSTSYQSELLGSYSSCSSLFSDGPTALSTTTQASSTPVPSASSSPIASSTTVSPTTETSSTAAITSAPSATTSVATVQQSSTTSSSTGAAHPALVIKDGLGGLLAFVAGIAALV